MHRSARSQQTENTTEHDVIRRSAAVLALCLVATACKERRHPVDVAWHEEQGGAYRWRDLDVSSRDKVGFKAYDAAATGITHRNDVADDSAIDSYSGSNSCPYTSRGRPNLCLKGDGRSGIDAVRGVDAR